MLKDINEQRQLAKQKGEYIAPTRQKSTIANMGERWRKWFTHVTHYRIGDDGEWVHKDTRTRKRGPEQSSYSKHQYDGIVDVIKTVNLDDDPVAKGVRDHPYHKFTDKHGTANVYLIYQAAHFIDWWCWYVGVDTWSQNVDLRSHQRVQKPWNREWFAYVEWKKFWITNTH